MSLNLPTILTIFRLCAAIAIAAIFLVLPSQQASIVALLLFLTASITDWLDGFIARTWKQETDLGAMLDPIADKALVLMTLSALVGLNGLTPWLFVPTVVIVFREVLVSGIREFMAKYEIRLAVTFLAKIKTSAQLAAISGLLLSECLSVPSTGLNGLIYDVSVLSLWIAAGLTLVSGWEYFRKSVTAL